MASVSSQLWIGGLGPGGLDSWHSLYERDVPSKTKAMEQKTYIQHFNTKNNPHTKKSYYIKTPSPPTKNINSLLYLEGEHIVLILQLLRAWGHSLTDEHGKYVEQELVRNRRLEGSEKKHGWLFWLYYPLLHCLISSSPLWESPFSKQYLMGCDRRFFLFAQVAWMGREKTKTSKQQSKA